MYGSVAHLRVKPGNEQGVLDYVTDWTRDRKPHTPGAMGGYVYQLDKDAGAWVFAVAFADKASYEANAQSPQMDADYQRLRSLLEADPVWEDGAIVAQF